MMMRLSRFTLLFAIFFALLIITPGLLSNQYGPYPLIKLGDVVDVFTSLILLPLYWIMLQLEPKRLPRQTVMVAFAVLAAAWASGQGMHLAANSIGHLLQESMGADINDLTYFYDETLSHIIWHLSIIGLSALLMVRQWNNPFYEPPAGRVMVTVAGILYGLTYFIAIIEGGTKVFGIPFALLASLLTVIWARDRLNKAPVIAFFFTGYLIATIFFVVWGIMWQGFPEFSDPSVGWID
jgi:hypothetical protein